VEWSRVEWEWGAGGVEQRGEEASVGVKTKRKTTSQTKPKDNRTNELEAREKTTTFYTSFLVE
jgi:hypothetical protein